MPGTPTTHAELPNPAMEDADIVPADLLALANALDQRVLLRATSAADRDARHGGVDDGTAVINTLDGTLWMRADGEWLTMWQKTTEWTNCTLGSTLQGPIQIRAELSGGKLKATMSGLMTKTDGTDISAATMGGGSVVCTVPASFIPTGASTPTIMMLGGISLTGGSFASVARLQLDTSSGQIIVFGNQNPATGGTPYEGTPWISFDSAWYWVDV